MSKRIDLSGTKYGRLTVVYDTSKRQRGNVVWHCICDCGNEVEVIGDSLKRGNTKSCGCLHSETTAKMLKNRNTKYEGDFETTTRLYKIWRGIKKRCNNQNCSSYANYGGRGISYCKEWEEYINFKSWALSNGYSDDLTIDRIDVNGNYEPSNCKWSSRKEQSNNKRSNYMITFQGKTQNMKQWAEELDLDYKMLHTRINKLGWDIERALTTQSRSSKSRGENS